MKTPNSFSSILLLLLIGLIPMKSLAQSNYKNAIRVSTFGGKYNISMELQYVRDIAPQFALLAFTGYEKIEAPFSDYACSNITSTSAKMGLGGEWRPMGEAKGIFVQGNLVLKFSDNVIRVRTSEDGEPVTFCNSILRFISGQSLSEYSLKDEPKKLGFAGKLGYRFSMLKGRFTFSPFASFEQSHFLNKNILLNPTDIIIGTNMADEPLEVNPYPEVKIAQWRLGGEVAIRF